MVADTSLAKAEKLTDKEIKVVKKEIEKIFELLEVQGDFTVEESEGGVEVVLSTQDTGVIIGYHGEMLESLQLVIALCVSKKIGRFVRVSLEVGDYKKNRIEWLGNLAQQAKEQALAERKEVPLLSLKSWERRIVHLQLQDDKEVISESVGEGKDRTLVVKPRE